MHDASKIGSFMALRANGWSLAKISKELNISKSTLWEWDNKNQNEIHLLKHLQLEKLQEKYLPTYEEELSKLRSYLDRLETALESQDFSKMGPEYLLQMALQLRARLGKMREQVPLRTVRLNEPAEPLPFTGCVSRQDDQTFREEFFAGEPDDTPEPLDPSTVAASRESADTSAEFTPIGARTVCPPETVTPSPASAHATATSPRAKPLNPESQSPPPATDNESLVIADTTPHALRDFRDSVVDSQTQNRTFPDETAPRPKHRPLYHNDFRYRDPEPRPVLNSQNGNGNGNGNHHVNGNGHPRGNGHHTSEDRRDQ